LVSAFRSVSRAYYYLPYPYLYPFYPAPYFPAPAYYPPPASYPPYGSYATPGSYGPPGADGSAQRRPAISYTQRPGWTNAAGQYCREYKSGQGAGNRAEHYGAACRDQDGQWRIVN
jgi:hypothetical protein